MADWIKCSERMPENTQMVLAFSQGEIVAAYWNYVVCPIDYKKIPSIHISIGEFTRRRHTLDAITRAAAGVTVWTTSCFVSAL